MPKKCLRLRQSSPKANFIQKGIIGLLDKITHGLNRYNILVM